MVVVSNVNVKFPLKHCHLRLMKKKNMGYIIKQVNEGMHG